jgi:hypothetical protein
MAGAFTHFMVCKEALKAIPAAIKRLVQGVRPNLYVGAVSPDIPYLAVPQAASSLSCADYMHYKRTNGIAVAAVQELHRQLMASNTRDIRNNAAWLFGYVSHLVADATIHPIVQEIVGVYEQNKTEHMRCEMVQDAFVFKQFTGREITDSRFIDSYLKPIDNQVMYFWRNLFYRTYFPQFEEDRKESPRGSARKLKPTTRNIEARRVRTEFLEKIIRPFQWLGWYRTLLSSSASGNFKNLTRQIGIGKSLSYPTTKEILRDYPDQHVKYFEKVKLPFPKRIDHFMSAGFERTVKNVLSAWQVTWKGIIDGQDITGYIKDWNLDTGEDQSSGEITFWS